ncbi:hypothetical protein ACX80I_12415 [Arthrobacter sp. MDT3-44]
MQIVIIGASAGGYQSGQLRWRRTADRVSTAYDGALDLSPEQLKSTADH